MWLALLLGGLLVACGEPEPQVSASSQERPPWGEGRVDTVGVRNIAEGDTASGHSGLTVIETTRTFGSGEVVGWEFYARELQPVKLIIVRYDRDSESFELVGESEMTLPRQKGVNRLALREPIPVERNYMFGLVMPKKEVIPFKKVLNWKTLITTHPLERPLMRRDYFANYGWRYSVRVFWRPREGPEE